MANELGPFSEAGKVVIFNPDAPTQVWDTVAAAWTELAVATFANCAIATAASGAFYFADLPAGLDADVDHSFALYASGATAFSDPSDLYLYDVESAAGGGGSGVIVTPIQADVREVSIASSVGGVDRTLKLFQNSQATLRWTIEDGLGDPYDMTGHGFAFVVHSKTGTVLFSINSTDNADQFALSSSAGDAKMDVIGVTLLPTDLTAARVGVHHYKLWNLDIDAVLGSGQLTIPHAPQGA